MVLCLYGIINSIDVRSRYREGEYCKVLGCSKRDGLIYLRVYIDDPNKYKDVYAWCEPNCPDLNSRDRVIHCCYLEEDMSSTEIYCQENEKSKAGLILYFAILGLAAAVGIILSIILVLMILYCCCCC